MATKKIKKTKAEYQEPRVFRVTDNSTVNLKSINNDGCKKVRISVINGYDTYAFLIGKPKGSTVRVDNAFWKIGYIEKDKPPKRYGFKYLGLSHPLNNSTHFVR